MKLKNKTTILLLAFAGVLLVAPAMKAATVAYSSDDLLLGFRATSGTGATSNYLVDLGQASLFTGAAGSTIYNLSSSPLGNAIGNLNADLVATYGANWATSGLVTYGIVGSTGQLSGVGSDPKKTLYATAQETQSGAAGTPQSTPWNSSGQIGLTAQSNAAGKIGGSSSLASAYNGQTSTANSAFGIVEATASPNSWSSFQASPAFGAFNPTVSDSVSNTLDLYTNQFTSNPFNFVGNFHLSQTGDLTFESAPEPGRAVLLSFGLAAALFRRRRKTVNA